MGMPDLDAGLEGLQFAWKHRRSLRRVSTELLRMARSGRSRVAVFGAAGTGKTTIAKLLTRSLTDEDLLAGYRDSFEIDTFGLPGTIFGHMLIAPGQDTRAFAREDLLELVKRGEILGVVNVVSYGYHAFARQGSYRDDPAFGAGQSARAFTRAYVEQCRAREIELLRQLLQAINQSGTKTWMLTFVNKQDLWWASDRAVRNHYENGAYAAAVRQTRAATDGQALRHDFAYGAVTWANFRDGRGELLAPTAAGYDFALRAEGFARLGRGLAELLGAKP
jgi:hypothetical protein